MLRITVIHASVVGGVHEDLPPTDHGVLHVLHFYTPN